MNLAQHTCTPCSSNVPAMTTNEALQRLADTPDWELAESASGSLCIARRFGFRNFLEAWAFVDQVSGAADQQGHHPDICFGWGYCNVSFYTHAIHGLHENDFIMAAKVNDIVNDPAFALAGAGIDDG